MIQDKRLIKSREASFNGSEQRHKKYRRESAYWIKLFIMLTLLPTFWGRNELYSMDILIDPCKSGTYLTIDSLYEYCKVPGECRRKYESEGKVALVKGVIDYLNIFDKTSSPNLPYQKFLMTNHEHSKSIEVWVTSDCSDLLFKKISVQKTLNPDSTVFIRGVLVGFDMPIMGACHRGLKLELTGNNSLTFDMNGDGRSEKGHHPVSREFDQRALAGSDRRSSCRVSIHRNQLFPDLFQDRLSFAAFKAINCL